MTYEETIDYYVQRGYETRNMKLTDLIQAENLDQIELGTINILTCNELSNAMVACKEFMILAREYYCSDQDRLIAEYAIYEQEDHDCRPLMNSLNANATYKCTYIGEEEFENVGAAIAYAVNLIYKTNKEESDHE